MNIQRFAAPLGATVTGLDVREADAATFQRLNDALCEHHVLTFPGQILTADEQIKFASFWGTLIPFPYGGLPDHPQLIELKNRGKQKDVNQHWHSDMTYNERPPKITMLYALQAPALGGETAFANQHLAYAELSAGLRSVVDQLAAFHSAQGLARLYGQDEAAAPRAHHPVVRTHDESGKRALYVCRAFTANIDGWSEADSQWLLRLLFERSVKPEYQARHRWCAGDLVMWDNRSVLHYAVHDHADEPRRILRCQIEGPTPC